METPDREMLAEAGVDPRSLAHQANEPQAVAVLAQAGLDADDEFDPDLRVWINPHALPIGLS